MIKYNNYFIMQYLITKNMDKSIIQYAVSNAHHDYIIQNTLDIMMEVADEPELLAMTFYSLESYLLEEADVPVYNC